MDPDLAQGVWLAIVATGAVVWLIALRFLATAHRAGRSHEPAEDDLSACAPENGLAGSAEVEGRPALLAARAASALAKGSVFGPVWIEEKADDRIAFERLGPGLAGQPAGRWFRQAELHFRPAGPGRSRVDWAVRPAGAGRLLGVGSLFLALGLVALVGGGWASYRFIVTSADPAVRWQTFQTAQVVHFLWPPFLFGALYRRGVPEVRAQFEALARNLPYVGG